MKNIKYTEPTAYFPKEIMDKYFGKKKTAEKKPATTKPAAKKPTTKKKPK